MERESTVLDSRKNIQKDRIIAIVVVIFFAFVTLFPLYWALRTALSTQKFLLADPTNLLPVEFTWASFQQALGMVSREDAIAAGGSGRTFDFWRYLANTVIIATAINLIVGLAP